MSKKTKFPNIPLPNDVKRALIGGLLDKNTTIKPSFLGMSLQFDDDGDIMNCFITPDKIGRKFADFTYENKLVKRVNKKTKPKLNKKPQTEKKR